MKISVTFTYCEQPDMLLEQLASWRLYPPELGIILVDDSSQAPPASDLLKGNAPAQLRLFRTLKAVPWNLGACRNIGVKESRADAVLIADLDHLMDPTVAAHLAGMEVASGTFYSPGRFDDSGVIDWTHEHLQLIRCDDFERVGGYDETWWGYEGDHVFVPRRNAVLERLFDPLLVLKQAEHGSSYRWSRSGRNNARVRGGLKYRQALVANGPSPVAGLTPYKEILL